MKEGRIQKVNSNFSWGWLSGGQSSIDSNYNSGKDSNNRSSGTDTPRLLLSHAAGYLGQGPSHIYRQFVPTHNHEAEDLMLGRAGT